MAAAAAAAADDDVRLVVVRGAGPVFCAGADLKERKDMSADEVRNRRLRGFAAYHALESLPMPTIAVVHGAAIGSGSEIAAACDFIVATPDATFSTPEAMWGTVGATQRLARVLGKRLAKDLMFTGRKLTADEARTGGLVTRIVPAGQLEEAIAEIAADHPQGVAGWTAPGQALHRSRERARSARGARRRAARDRGEPRAGPAWRVRMAGFRGPP